MKMPPPKILYAQMLNNFESSDILSFSALTKTEIRRYESKLIEYFSKQLTARNSLTQAQWLKVADKLSQYPSLSQVSALSLNSIDFTYLILV